ncbi:MAG: class I SAM-dependent methyltransferase [Candidatus Melainabacteria bacterium]|nr:class I SAM-dependent methyltransferase [Candidatus Melainabacteria bacterium]
MDAKALYLDLLAKSLTNTLFVNEPDSDQESQAQFVKSFIEHYISGSAITMLPMARIENLRNCIINTIERSVPGDLIETGVWRGGATIFMRAILKAYEVSDKIVWVADSFEGLPEPDAELNPIEHKAYSGPVMTKVYKHFAVGLEEVKRNFAAYGLLDDQVRFLKGWFKDTLPNAPIKSLSVIRLDGDFYESTLDSLNNLYPKLSRGGYVIIDDYGEESWTECKRAVEEFRSKHAVKDELFKVDSNCYYWQRA